MALGTGTRDTNDPQGGTEKGLPRIKPENCASTGTCCHRLVISHFQSIKGEETDKNKTEKKTKQKQQPTKQNPLFFSPGSRVAFLMSLVYPRDRLSCLVLQIEQSLRQRYWVHLETVHALLSPFGRAWSLPSVTLDKGTLHLANKHLLLKNKPPLT